MLRSLAVAAAIALSVSLPAAASAQTATLPGGFSFKDWLTVNNAAVGNGKVDDSNVVYFLKEKSVGGFQSWLIFFDPSGTQSVSGSVTFADPISFLYTTKASIDASTAIYGLASVTYQTSNAIGLETNDAASFVGNTLSFSWHASDPGDHVRVLTRAADPNVVVPEPSTYAMLGLGMLVMAGIARRRHIV